MKLLRWLVAILAVLVAAAVGALWVYFYVLHPTVKPPALVTAPRTEAALARGKYLVENVAACLVCHSDTDASSPGDPIKPGRLGSGRDFNIPDFPGHVRAANLTPDREHGLGAWSDGEIVRAIREGISKNDRPLFPMMPYGVYAFTLGDEDALAIVAYLRSLPALASDPGPMEVKFPVAMFVRAAPRPVDKPAPPEPPESDVVARGNWLLEVAVCAECHSTMDNGRPREGMRFAGNDVPFVDGSVKVYAPNLTSDPANGIGAYADEDILRALGEGIAKNGMPIYAMPVSAYRGMTDDDKRAIVAALRKLPAVVHAVPASTKPLLGR